MNKKQNRKLALFFLPGVVGVVLFFLVPLGVCVYFSFGASSPFWNYDKVLQSQAFRLAITNTLKLIGMGLPVILAGGVALAIGQWKLLKQGLSGTRTLFSLYLLPIVLPSALVVFFIKILLPFDTAPEVVWLMVGLYIWKNIPYALLAAFLGLRNLPEGVQDAARVDGASGWQMLRHITLPFLKPYILVGAVLALLGIFRIFRESYLLFGNYPDQSVYYLQNYMNNLFYASNYGQLAAASEIFLVGISVILLLALYFLGKEVQR